MLSRLCLKELADKKPFILKHLCENLFLSVTELTFALEYLGQTEMQIFEEYLTSVAVAQELPPLVREGAYLGLSYLEKFDEDKVMKSFRDSTSPGLQSFASEFYK